MKMSRVIAAFALLFVLQACGTYSTSSSNDSPSAQQIVANRVHKIPDQIYLTQGDILDRPYTSLSDISVTVRKVTIFDSDPTQAAVDKALKEKAAEMGADAVVFVRYGTVGISLMSWGELDGKGRAIVFQ
jgi:hypothetical protein